MGRWGGWMKGIALLLAVLAASCGNTGGNSSSSGDPFVFQARGRLNLIAQPVTGSNSLSVSGSNSRSVTDSSSSDPTVLNITAILLDPQGNPFRNQRVTFEAEFADATFIPANTSENQTPPSLACLPQASNGNVTRCTNRGAAITDDFGQAQVTLIAGLTLGNMRVTAEAPAALNISSAITVKITQQGFLGGVDLAIIPTSVQFINPFVSSDPNNTTTTVFNAVGGKPPYTWSNANTSLGILTPQTIPNTTIANQAVYSLTGPIPATTTTGSGSPFTDTITLQDAAGTSVTAAVNVIFADCDLKLSADKINFGNAKGGEKFDIKVTDGVAPFTATHSFPEAGTISVDQNAEVVTFTIATPPFAVDPDTIVIRDSRGCVGKVDVTIAPAQVANALITASPKTISGTTGGVSTITFTALDSNNKPFAGVTIVFTTDTGTLSSDTAVTDANGKATVTLTIPAGTAPGIATVTGAAPGATTPSTVQINIS